MLILWRLLIASWTTMLTEWECHLLLTDRDGQSEWTGTVSLYPSCAGTYCYGRYGRETGKSVTLECAAEKYGVGPA